MQPKPTSLEWIDYEDDVPHLCELVRKHEHFDEYFKSVLIELGEDADGYTFGCADGDPVADLEDWDQWYTSKTKSPWAFPVLYTQKAHKQKATELRRILYVSIQQFHV